jgi:hypothetical protein
MWTVWTIAPIERGDVRSTRERYAAIHADARGGVRAMYASLVFPRLPLRGATIYIEVPVAQPTGARPQGGGKKSRTTL